MDNDLTFCDHFVCSVVLLEEKMERAVERAEVAEAKAQEGEEAKRELDRVGAELKRALEIADGLERKAEEADRRRQIAEKDLKSLEAEAVRQIAGLDAELETLESNYKVCERVAEDLKRKCNSDA